MFDRGDLRLLAIWTLRLMGAAIAFLLAAAILGASIRVFNLVNG